MQENYLPNRRERFLWWLSTAETVLLKNAVVDRNRHAIIGMLVLGTWSFATLAWTYFFSTVVPSLWMAAALGLFMGGIILFIDRALIKGIHQTGKLGWKPLVFRLCLAFTIGLFMAQPALLFLFDKEIKVQASLDNEIRQKNKLAQLEQRFSLDRNRFMQQKTQASQAIQIRYQAMVESRNQFIQETDGTGGSKKIGLQAIALAKKEAAEKAALDYQEAVNLLQPSIANADSNLQIIQQQMAVEKAAFNGLMNHGLITRIEAMDHLIQQNNAVAFRYYLLVVLLMLIELMPVLAKYLLPSGTYAVYANQVETEEIKWVNQLSRNEPTDSV